MIHKIFNGMKLINSKNLNSKNDKSNSRHLESNDLRRSYNDKNLKYI